MTNSTKTDQKQQTCAFIGSGTKSDRTSSPSNGHQEQPTSRIASQNIMLPSIMRKSGPFAWLNPTVQLKCKGVLICSHSKPSQTTVRMHHHSNHFCWPCRLHLPCQFQLEALLTSLLRCLPSFHLHITTLGINLIISQHMIYLTQSL